MMTSVDQYLNGHPSVHLLAIPSEVLALARQHAYRTFHAPDHTQTIRLCEGLRAANHLDWWPYALQAAVLSQQGRLREAVRVVDEGLRFIPGRQELLTCRSDIVSLAERIAAAWLKTAPPGRPGKQVCEATPGPAQAAEEN